MADVRQQIRELFSTRQNRLALVLITVLFFAGLYLTYSYWQARISERERVAPTPRLELFEPGEAVSEEGIYIVQAGDTLWSIAEEQLGDGFRWREIAGLNGLPPDDPRVEIGQELRLPVGRRLAEILGDEVAIEEGGMLTSPSPTPTLTSEPTLVVRADEEGDLDGEGVSVGGPQETPATASGGEYYTVQRGDSLWSIAESFYHDGLLWREIYEANPVSMYQAPNGSVYPLIHAGNVLYLPEVNL